MSGKYGNSKKTARLDNLPKASLDDKNDCLTEKCKFNFNYMDFSQEVRQTFEDWSKSGQLIKLFDKLKNYSGEPLEYWRNQRHKKQHTLEIYGNFPLRSKFKHPTYIPHQVQWARFRLENLVRLIGFVIPNEYNGEVHEGTKQKFDSNTFYVVFLDQNHEFYQS